MAKKQKTGRIRIRVERDILEDLKKMCKSKGHDIDGLLKRLVLYPNLTEQLLSFPDEINMSMMIDANTIAYLLPLWMDNLSENLARIKEDNDIKDIPQVDNLPALIIGAGPSLYRKKHLELLAEKGFNGHIFATDAVLKDCLEHGVIPDYVLFIDASDDIYHFVDYDIVDKYADKVAAIMCVAVHPSVVKRWKGKIYWYQALIEELYGPNVNHILELITHTTSFGLGGHCSATGWAFAILKGHNPIGLIGVDLSYPTDIPVEETRMYKFHLNETYKGNKEETLKSFDKHYHHKFFNTDCYYEPLFEHYTNVAKKQFKILSTTNIKVINCTEGGTLEGEGIKCMWFSDYLDSHQRKK